MLRRLKEVFDKTKSEVACYMTNSSKKKKNCAEFYHGNRKSNKKRWKRQQHLMKKVQLLAKAERTMKKLKKKNLE